MLSIAGTFRTFRALRMMHGFGYCTKRVTPLLGDRAGADEWAVYDTRTDQTSGNIARKPTHGCGNRRTVRLEYHHIGELPEHARDAMKNYFDQITWAGNTWSV